MKIELEQSIDIKLRDKVRAGECDKKFNLQPPTAPKPSIGMRIDVLCNYVDDVDNDDFLMRSQGYIK